MSESKHTRGPWRVDGPSIAGRNPNMGLWDVEGATNVANACTLYDARLIAAAPDLLEALRVAQHTLVAAQNYRVTDLTVEVFDAHLANGVPRDRLEFMTDYTGELARIDAAIAKATGGEA